MDYKCEDCGHIFNSGEAAVVLDNAEWIGGDYFEEKRDACPCCGSLYIQEAHRCIDCGGLFLEDELEEGFCADCIDTMLFKLKRDPIGCFSVAKNNGATEAVSLNIFLATMFSPEEIEQILLRELVEASAVIPVDCTPFIECDRSAFIETAANMRKGARK